MLVKELIELLQNSDPELPVVIGDGYSGDVFALKTARSVHIALSVRIVGGRIKYDVVEPPHQRDLFESEDATRAAILLE